MKFGICRNHQVCIMMHLSTLSLLNCSSVIGEHCINQPLFSSSEDKGALAKLVEAIKTNYNDRYEEVSICLNSGNTTSTNVCRCQRINSII